jgi:Tfp pilus assembly protein FimT
MRNRGWSILELLIVALIITICGGMAVARFVEARAVQTLQETARILAMELSSLRVRAISLNEPLSLVVGADGKTYGLAVRKKVPTRWITLPEGIRFTKVPSSPVTFYSRANAAPAGSLVLTSEKAGAVRVVVAPFGRIRWEWLP